MLLFIGLRESVTTGILGNPGRTALAGSWGITQVPPQMLVEKHVEENCSVRVDAVG
jgi:hypothetical protein